jgi:hypothetical protein
MNDTQKIPSNLAWNGEHASDLSIETIADGHARLLEEAIVAHVEACPDCARALGDAALFSVGLGTVMRAMPKSAFVIAEGEAPVKLPLRAITIALGVALLGALPSLPLLPDRALSLYAHARALITLGNDGDAIAIARDAMHAPIGLAVSFAAALILIATGAWVTRALPHSSKS